MAKHGITFSHRGSFSKTMKFFNHLLKKDYLNVLNKYGNMGVIRLQEFTPKDTGVTAYSWSYDIEEDKDRGVITLRWTNSNIVDYVNIALIIQYGHATRNGGWVEGRDYINPALQPVFDKIARDVWLEVIE